MARSASEQDEGFQEAERERDKAFQQASDDYESRVAALEADARSKTKALVSEIERMKQESEALVGSIGVTGTAGRYKEEADAQRKVANIWRYATVSFALVAAGVAIYAALQADQTIVDLAAKVAVAITFGALAAYAARQSSRHREREETARSVQLDLAAFGPFIEALPKRRQDEERVELGRKVFGRSGDRPQSGSIEPGPTAVGQVLGEAAQGIRQANGAGSPPQL